MANLWLDLKGPILADTVYVDGVLAAKDVTIALPPVNLVTADFKAMGTYTAPLPGQIEAMEASITKIGIDLGLRSLVKLTSKTIEIRWAQDDPRRQSFKILNPLGEDTSIMRTTTLPSMLEILTRNYNFRNKSAKLYELGRVYFKRADGLADEPKVLTLGA